MIADAVARALRFVARRPVALTLAAEPDAALLATAAALRRLGARITRYDGDAGTLEARHDVARVRVAVSADGEERSRLHLHIDDAPLGFVRRLRTELARPAKGDPAR